MVKNPALRLGTKSGMKEILAHPVLLKPIISSDMVDLKPKVYNINQDFLDIKHRKKVGNEYNERTDYAEEMDKN